MVNENERKPRYDNRGGESCLAPGRGSKVPTSRKGEDGVVPFRVNDEILGETGHLEEKIENGI